MIFFNTFRITNKKAEEKIHFYIYTFYLLSRKHIFAHSSFFLWTAVKFFMLPDYKLYENSCKLKWSDTVR